MEKFSEASASNRLNAANANSLASDICCEALAAPGANKNSVNIEKTSVEPKAEEDRDARRRRHHRSRSRSRSRSRRRRSRSRSPLRGADTRETRPRQNEVCPRK
jgi:hypothetical protein